MTLINWNDYANFSESEFRCHCGCGKAQMEPEFMAELQKLRDMLEFPLSISSGFRCPDHNERVSSTGRTGPHTTGRAADVQVSHARTYDVLNLAMLRFHGIGIAQKGPASTRFVHLDMARPFSERRVWSY